MAGPVVAVGDWVARTTPSPVQRWAIDTFGRHDKAVLLVGLFLVLAFAAAASGVIADYRLRSVVAAVVALGGLGAYLAASAPAGRASDAVPSAIAGLVAAAALVLLMRAGRAPSVAAGSSGWLSLRLGRRGVLVGGAVALLAGGAAGAAGRALQRVRFDVGRERAGEVLPRPAEPAPALPAGVDLQRSGLSWATTNSSFYRVDTALSLPQVSAHTWSMRIHGLVGRELTLRYADLLAMPLVERWITMTCVSNEVGGDLVGNARWLGVRLADVLRSAVLDPAADQLLMTSIDGMTIGGPLAVMMDGRDALIAIGMNGVVLPVEHGYPVRIVVPGLYGYVSACKWVVELEATTFTARSAYWVQEGYLPHPELVLASRIDKPHPYATVTLGRPVVVAGVAWDQHVGVSAVQVQVDDGPWQPTRLAAVPSTDTWRQWVLVWTPAERGVRTLRVRAIGARGNVQTDLARAVFPGPATGLHGVGVIVK
jgi:DMSO/TMAO reductase YedYZ molybdopterin-dependent catalytic subunit